MEVFRVLANKNYGNGRIKNHDLQRLIDPHALQDIFKRPIFDRTQKVGCSL